MADYFENTEEELDETVENEGMTDDEFQGAVSALVDDAAAYIDEDVAPHREAATAYYRGDPLGNEEEGRSKVVSTDVRDVVQRVLPSLMRIFAGSERAVEYSPTTEAEIPVAENATDYVNNLFYEKNNGFKVLWDGFKDALIRKTGVLTWWAEDKEIVKEFEDYGFTQDMIDMLAAEEGVEIVSVEDEEPQEPQPPPGYVEQAHAMAESGDPALIEQSKQMIMALRPETTYTVRFKRRKIEKLIKVACIPPEEFFISRNAACVDDALAVGRRREMTVSDLVSLGYNREVIEEHMGSSTPSRVGINNNEAVMRNPALDEGRGIENSDPSLKRVLYTEAYVRVDKDQDGIAELRRVCLLGDGHYVLHDEIWEDETPPYAILCPDPEPHTAIGFSLADQVADIQEIKSNVLRNTLDSLADSIFPRTVVVEGQANLDDVMNTEIGAVIRVRQPGAVQELTKTFVGQQAYPLIQYLDQTRASRTGISDASAGLEPDLLQSTTKAAVTATVNGQQERIELIARIFAETALKRMFAALLRLCIRHHRKPMLAKLRSGWTNVNPSEWNPDMEVAVMVGLGRGSDSERAAMMAQVLQVQKELLSTMGLNQPLVGPTEIRNTLAKLLEIAGVKDTTRYFKLVDPNWQPPQPEQKPSDAELLAQVEVLKAQVAKQEADQKHLREMMKIKLEADLERDRLENERWLKANELALKYGAQLDEAFIRAHTEARRQDVDQIIAETEAQQQMQSEALAAQAAQALQAQQQPQVPPTQGPAF